MYVNNRVYECDVSTSVTCSWVWRFICIKYIYIHTLYINIYVYAYICVDECDMFISVTCLWVWRVSECDEFIGVICWWVWVFTGVSFLVWRVHKCSYVWQVRERVVFMSVTCSYAHDPFISVTWQIDMCVISHPYIYHQGLCMYV